MTSRLSSQPPESSPAEQTEEALRESEARMRSLLDSAADGIWGLDLEGRCTFANPACARLLGYARAEDLLGQLMHPLTHHTHADGRPYPHAECLIYEAFRTRQDKEVENEIFFRQDGTSFPVHYRASPIIRQGAVVGAVVTFKNITERQRIEAERTRTLTMLDTLATHAAEALYLMDAHGQVTFMNPAAERMFGWSSEEVRGKLLHEVVHYKHLDGTPFPMEECVLGRVMSTGQPALRHEDEFIHKDGHFIPVSCSNAPVLTEGRVTGAVLVVHDLTERRRAQNDARQRAEFEQQLIGIVSHDLRNPISAMLLSAQALMRREGTPPATLKGLARIMTSGERATRLIHDLLDFTQARLGTGISIQRQPLSFHELIRQTVEELQLAYPEREVRLQTSGDGQGAWDPGRLAHVITNLVSNAITYSPEGTIVQVVTRGEESTVSLEVHNQGTPIPEDLLPVLFEPFRRGRAARPGSSGNIGLGLFIVHQLVHAHGGSIAVRSTEADGTTFTVRLPRR
ncbi:MAG TPA: PAS domain-containing sensor histidine kinase [Myxococcaceae bacterium]